MAKLTKEEKIEIYIKRKEGITLNTLSLAYKVSKHSIQYLIRLIDRYGFDVLIKTKNKKYPKYIKENAINTVLNNNESSMKVALDLGLVNDGMLRNWIKKYKENGYNIVERKRGRSPTMKKNPKQINKEKTKDEIIKKLEEENLYLKAELEYSKKLRAVVQARKNQQQKKK